MAITFTEESRCFRKVATISWDEVALQEVDGFPFQFELIPLIGFKNRVGAGSEGAVV